MRKYIILTILLVFFIVFNSYAGYDPAYIFFVNLYYDWVDLRVGEQRDYVFMMDGLEPFSATYMLEVWDTGSYDIYYKMDWESDRDWYYWDWIDIDEGYIYCIIMDQDGYIEWYWMEDPYYYEYGAYVCFLNGGPYGVYYMEVAEWGFQDGTVAWCEDLDAYMVTNFVAVDEGEYMLYWQYPEDKRSGDYWYYADDSGRSEEIFYFWDSEYYLFMVWEDYDGYIDVELYNITTGY
jgi:hypothetical protein